METGQISSGCACNVQRNYILVNTGNETVVIPASQMSEHFVEVANGLFQISQEVDFIALEKRESGGNVSIRSLDVLKHKNPREKLKIQDRIGGIVYDIGPRGLKLHADACTVFIPHRELSRDVVRNAGNYTRPDERLSVRIIGKNLYEDRLTNKHH